LSDVQLRLVALEAGFSSLKVGPAHSSERSAIGVRLDGIERRQISQKERMTRMRSLLVRIAERLDGH